MPEAITDRQFSKIMWQTDSNFPEECFPSTLIGLSLDTTSQSPYYKTGIHICTHTCTQLQKRAAKNQCDVFILLLVLIFLFLRKRKKNMKLDAVRRILEKMGGREWMRSKYAGWNSQRLNENFLEVFQWEREKSMFREIYEDYSTCLTWQTQKMKHSERTLPNPPKTFLK